MATAFSHADGEDRPRPLAGIDAVILAGGLGTRLRSVLPDRQKVLAEVEGQPFLGKLIDFYAGAGATRIVLALGHRSGDVESYVRDYEAPWDLIASVEPEPRGTGGALRHALPHLQSDTVLVANGDSFAIVDLAALVDLHVSRRSTITMALTFADDVARYGRVVFDGDGAVERFEEKPTGSGGGVKNSGYINAGVYLIEREIIAALPSDRAISLERDVFPQRIEQGLYALDARVPFIDIGTPESWRSANDFFANIEKLKRTP